MVSSEESLKKNVTETALRLASYAPEAVKNLRKLHWKETDHWETLLPQNAEITAKLVLEEATQNILKSL